MANEMKRRDFLKAAAIGTAGIAAAGMLGAPVFASEEEKAAEFEGTKKFAGVGCVRQVAEDISYVGASEKRTELFENVYPIPRGVAYNSYMILDEKTVLVDTVDRSVVGQFF